MEKLNFDKQITAQRPLCYPLIGRRYFKLPSHVKLCALVLCSLLSMFFSILNASFNKEVVGTRVLLGRPAFGRGIRRRMLPLASPGKPILLLCGSDGLAERSLNL
jgi:hypothetical protein